MSVKIFEITWKRGEEDESGVFAIGHLYDQVWGIEKLTGISLPMDVLSPLAEAAGAPPASDPPCGNRVFLRKTHWGATDFIHTESATCFPVEKFVCRTHMSYRKKFNDKIVKFTPDIVKKTSDMLKEREEKIQAGLWGPQPSEKISEINIEDISDSDVWNPHNHH